MLIILDDMNVNEIRSVDPKKEKLDLDGIVYVIYLYRNILLHVVTVEYCITISKYI